MSLVTAADSNTKGIQTQAVTISIVFPDSHPSSRQHRLSRTHLLEEASLACDQVDCCRKSLLRKNVAALVPVPCEVCLLACLIDLPLSWWVGGWAASVGAEQIAFCGLRVAAPRIYGHQEPVQRKRERQKGGSWEMMGWRTDSGSCVCLCPPLSDLVSMHRIGSEQHWGEI